MDSQIVKQVNELMRTYGPEVTWQNARLLVATRYKQPESSKTAIGGLGEKEKQDATLKNQFG